MTHTVVCDHGEDFWGGGSAGLTAGGRPKLHRFDQRTSPSGRLPPVLDRRRDPRRRRLREDAEYVPGVVDEYGDVAFAGVGMKLSAGQVGARYRAAAIGESGSSSPCHRCTGTRFRVARTFQSRPASCMSSSGPRAPYRNASRSIWRNARRSCGSATTERSGAASMLVAGWR
jgi:hypothetical protein